MSGTNLPDWLVGALPAAAQRGAAPALQGVLAAGDVCRLTVSASQDRPSDGRLVVVLDVDPDGRLASVMLAHSDFDIRTSLDVLAKGEELGLPFDLAFETDLVGPVAAGSLSGTVLGHVERQLFDDLRDAVDSGEIPESLSGRVGVPLRGPNDARWDWKVEEGALLDRLLAAHAPAHAEGVSPLQALAEALRAVGGCVDLHDDLDTVTVCLFAYKARRETPPPQVLTLLAQPPIAAALGKTMLRAIGPLLRVA